MAADGDPTTAWRTAAFDDAVGERIELTAPSPVRTDHVAPAPAQSARTSTAASPRSSSASTAATRSGSRSTASRSHAPGQLIDFGDRTFSTLSVEILADTAGRRPGYGGLTSVGFAEIDLAGLHGRRDHPDARPTCSTPPGSARPATRSSLVQTRDAPGRHRCRATGRGARPSPACSTCPRRGSFDGPTARPGCLRMHRRPLSIACSDAPASPPASPSWSPTATCPAGFRHLPSNVLDGDPSTWWTTRFGVPEHSVLDGLGARTPVTADRIGIQLDRRRRPLGSRPRVEVLADGVPIGTFDVGARPPPPAAGRHARPPGAVTASTFELRFPACRRLGSTTNWYGGVRSTLPMAIAEVDVAGLRVAPVADDHRHRMPRRPARRRRPVPSRCGSRAPPPPPLDGRGARLIGCATRCRSRRPASTSSAATCGAGHRPRPRSARVAQRAVRRPAASPRVRRPRPRRIGRP